MSNRSQEHLARQGREPSDGMAIVVKAGVNFTGTLKQGQTLTAVAPSVRGAIDNLAIAYQWFRGRNPIAGATNNTYLLAAADLGQYITLRAVITSDNAPAVTSFSPAHGPIAVP